MYYNPFHDFVYFFLFTDMQQCQDQSTDKFNKGKITPYHNTTTNGKLNPWDAQYNTIGVWCSTLCILGQENKERPLEGGRKDAIHTLTKLVVAQKNKHKQQQIQISHITDPTPTPPQWEPVDSSIKGTNSKVWVKRSI